MEKQKALKIQGFLFDRCGQHSRDLSASLHQAACMHQTLNRNN